MSKVYFASKNSPTFKISLGSTLVEFLDGGYVLDPEDKEEAAILKELRNELARKRSSLPLHIYEVSSLQAEAIVREHQKSRPRTAVKGSQDSGQHNNLAKNLAFNEALGRAVASKDNKGIIPKDSMPIVEAGAGSRQVL